MAEEDSKASDMIKSNTIMNLGLGKSKDKVTRRMFKSFPLYCISQVFKLFKDIKVN